MEILAQNTDCLFIANHLDWRKGWALTNLSRQNRYSHYLKINGEEELHRKRLHWLLIRPVNGLANRIRFLISSLALGHHLKSRCFLNWSISEGFDQTRFGQLFDERFLGQYGVTEISPLQFDLLSNQSFRIESHVPGILNGLQKVENYTCSVNPSHFKQHSMLSITGSNFLVYVFDYFKPLKIVNDYVQPRTKILMSSLKPSKSLLESIGCVVDRETTYGFHLRRGETLNFDLSRTGYFLQIAQSILSHEPLAKFFVSTNSQPTLNFFRRHLPRDALVFREKPFLERVDWHFSYLDSTRPDGSSLEALADLWLLRGCKKVYGTYDSSFSMVASLWGGSSYGQVTGHDLGELYNHYCPGWSLVTCCMNREQNLLLNISSWIACPMIREIVIIDWSSSTPLKERLKEQGFLTDRVRCFRVENQSTWILTWAYNLAISLARFDKIIKIDCDIYVSPDFFERNANFESLNSQSFYTGDWQKSNQIHLNGQVILRKIDFLRVNGYNEFLTKYGFDDTDLYHRLERLGLKKIKFSDSCEGRSLIYHRDHTDQDRVRHQVSNHRLSEMIEQNRILSQKMTWGRRYDKHRYLIDEDTGAVHLS
jgi:hypothetical protein